MKKVVIRGVEYPSRVTLGAMVRFKRETGKDIQSIREEDIESTMIFLWCCVVSACNADGVEFNLPFEVFADSISVEEFNNFFADAMVAQKKTKAKEEAKA